MRPTSATTQREPQQAGDLERIASVANPKIIDRQASRRDTPVIRNARSANDPAWLDLCVLSDNGKPLAVLASALAALRAELPDTFAYDEMLCAPMLMQALDDKPGFAPRPVTDFDVGIVQERLQHLGLQRLSKDVVHQAVDVRACERRIHPVRDYLTSLRWDHTERLDHLLPTYFGATDTAYARKIGPMFLVSMIARIITPGCKARPHDRLGRAAGHVKVHRLRHTRRRVVLRKFARHHRRQGCRHSTFAASG